jgi:hypothetical protein
MAALAGKYGPHAIPSGLDRTPTPEQASKMVDAAYRDLARSAISMAAALQHVLTERRLIEVSRIQRADWKEA